MFFILVLLINTTFSSHSPIASFDRILRFLLIAFSHRSLRTHPPTSSSHLNSPSIPIRSFVFVSLFSIYFRSTQNFHLILWSHSLIAFSHCIMSPHSSIAFSDFISPLHLLIVFFHCIFQPNSSIFPFPLPSSHSPFPSHSLIASYHRIFLS